MALEAVPDTQTVKIGASDLDSQRILASSLILEDGSYQTEFTIPDMHCAGCIGKIERGLSELAFVRRARANLTARRVSIVWDRQQANPAALERTLDQLGFEHHLFDIDEPVSIDENRKGRQLLLSLAVAGFAAANIMLLSVSVWSGASAETAKLFHLLSGLIAVPAVAFAGRPFFSSALRALRVMKLNMDVPISLAVILALAMGIYESLSNGEEAYFDAAVTLLFFLLIGRYLDHLMREKARGAVQRLARLSAKGAILVDGVGSMSYIANSDIKRGMRLRILPGERFPVDGTILIGETELDRSLVTGESDSVFSGPDVFVESGVLNLTGVVEIEAAGTVSESFLAEVMRMMDAAENGRSSYTRIADRMAEIYAPAVHALAFVTFIGWIFYTAGDWHASLYTAIAVLIITCPCALGLAVPVAHVVSASRLFREGIMMRDGGALERLANATIVLFDKTGTLTRGRPVVSRVLGDISQKKEVIAAVAASSSHPNARAVYEHLGIDALDRVSNIAEVPGYGIEANSEMGLVRMGRLEWVGEIAAKTDLTLPEASVVAVAIEDHPPILFELQDDMRGDVKESIELLEVEGLPSEILSGDRAVAVSAAAREAGIRSFSAELDPKEKIQRVEQLQAKGEKVLFVGDGLNDAPALIAGHVSMAPASASDVGRLASDLVFTRDSLFAVPHAVRIARRTQQVVFQNFGIALAYNCIAVPLAMAGLVTPLIAAIAMSLSSIAVVANSLRLNTGGGHRQLSKPDRSQANLQEQPA